MSRRGSKLTVLKRLIHHRRHAASIGERAEVAAEQFFFRRLDRLAPVRRFVIGWLVLLGLLCGCLVGQIRALDSHFQSLQPTAGGVYTEGVLGDFTNANPLYASSQVDESVSRLLFASLFKYDENNKLVGDLAQGYTVDSTSKVYTVTLKPNLTWHDGAPLTAKDVAYTYRMIQNPDTLSIHNKGWQGIKVEAAGPATIHFTLPSVLGSFPYNMTTGIIPEHILRDIAPAEMRSLSFNTDKPVGSGPFMWNTIEVSGDSPETRQAQIALTPFKNYHAGSPKLSSFVVHAFHDQSELTASFKMQELTAAGFTDMPGEIADEKGVQTNSFVLSAANMVFFKHSNPVLADTAVRKALVQSVNVGSIIDDLSYTTRPVRGPFLIGQPGYDNKLVQPPFDTAAAASGLEAAGWKVGSDGVRAKAGVPLRFSLYAQNMSESRSVSEQLVKAWRTAGAEVTVRLLESQDLQRSISSDEYDALLYGISIGVDPDVFVYWHSSQNDPRSSGLNFAEFKSKAADTALEAGRTRIEPELRTIKYQPFLQAWQQDTPALGLYQPRYLYMSRGTVYGMKPHIINSNTDRYTNIHNWQIRQLQATNN